MSSHRLDEIDLHDGQIIRTNVDHEKRLITIDITYYRSMEDKSRQPATLTFTEVDVFSCMSDAWSLVDNAKAGNISHWQPSEIRGTTFIYLVGGTLAIAAKSVSLQDRHDV